MSTLWGEMPPVLDDDPALTALERDQLSKPRYVEVEGPALHQPSLRHFPPLNEAMSSTHFELDPLTHHTIQLVQYARRIRSLMHSVRQQMQEAQKLEESTESLLKTQPTFPPTPVIPAYEGPSLKHQPQKPLPFITKDSDSAFVRGIGKPPPEIEGKTCRKLLRKSVAAICAHAGYDACSDSILETLTDVCHEYFLQITQLLRNAVDEEATSGTSGFPDAIERVLHEIGVGSRLTLHDFYQNRIIKYCENMLRRCQALQQEYENMKNPDYKFDEAKSSRSKDEPFGESSIHFPSLAEFDNDESVDNDSLQFEGLAGLDMSVSQDHSAEEDARWPHSIKTETSDSRVGSLEGFEQDDAQSTGTDIPNTPAMSSEAGESIQDPGSVSGPDMMSPPPPTIGMRTPTNKPPKKKRKT